jgi:hypothetical protein
VFTGLARQKPPAKWQDLGHFPPLCVTMTVAWVIITKIMIMMMVITFMLPFDSKCVTLLVREAPDMKGPQAMLVM